MRRNKLTRNLPAFFTTALLGLCLVGITPGTAMANWLHNYGITSKYELKTPAAAPKLAKALKDPNPKIRIGAIKYLIKLGPGARAAIPDLGEVLLKDVNVKIKIYAANAMASIGGPYNEEAAAAYMQALKDPNVHVRKAALVNIQKSTYRGTDLQEELQRVSSADPHPGLRKIATAIMIRTPQWEQRTITTAERTVAERDEQRYTDEEFTGFDLPETQNTNRHAVAVIIGNRNYAAAQKGVPDVDYAENDAQLMFDYVTKTLGYREGNIIFMKDATQADFISTFGTKDNPKGKLYDWIRPNQSDVFVYYSGHGAPGLNNGRSFLLPVNADPMKVELNGYSLETLYANIGKLPAKSVMVVIDACFSGGSASGTIVKSASSISLKLVEAEPSLSTGATILTAARAQEVASWDDQAEQGLFTRHFIEGVSGKADGKNYGNGDGMITLAELKKYLNEEVSYRARRKYGRDQHPQVNGDDSTVLTVLAAD